MTMREAFETPGATYIARATWDDNGQSVSTKDQRSMVSLEDAWADDWYVKYWKREQP
jgi:hypothetical protein